MHEIKEEQIQREIHNHDVYHRVQPVYDVEVKPARHYVSDNNGGLVEVSEADLPDCTGNNQNWYIGRREPSESWYTPRDSPELSRVKTEDEKRYMTPEGFARTEKTVVHPPALEDMSSLTGPVLPVYFDEHGRAHEMPIMEYGETVADKEARS